MSKLNKDFTFTKNKTDSTNDGLNYKNLRNSFVKYDNRSKFTSKNCCTFIKNVKGTFELFIPNEKIYYANINTEYIKRWMDYTKSLGFDIEMVEVNSTATSVDSYSFENGYIFKIKPGSRLKGENESSYKLAAHSLVRMLWSQYFFGVIDTIFELRDNPTYKELDNWEIFHLASIIKKSYGYHGIVPGYDNEIYKSSILSMDAIVSRRQSSKFSNLHSTYNIYRPLALKKTDVTALIKSKDYMALYKLFKAPKLKGSFIKYIGKNISTDAKLTTNNFYEVSRFLLKGVRLIDEYRDVVFVSKKDYEI